MKLIRGDCRKILPTLADACVDAVVTDPPYGTGAWLRNGKGRGRDCRAEHKKERWDVWRTDWLDDAWRVSKGCIGLFLASREMKSLLRWIGDKQWRMFVWVKTDPRPRFNGQPAYAFDPFVVVGKVRPAGGSDVFLYSSPRVRRDREAHDHPHQKRRDLMIRLLDLCCPPEGIVLDPFMGSGTTGVACKLTGRDFIGVEKDKDYFKVAQRRVEATPFLKGGGDFWS